MMNRSTPLLLLLLVSFGCDTSPKEKADQKEKVPPQYFYYPRANVYFDSANKSYVFLSYGSFDWHTAENIPAAMQSLMDKSVRIQNPSEPVWQENENHKIIYSALLYAMPNDTAQTQTVPVKEEVVAPSTVPVEETKKERKGLRKFLDKIFGGNKKKKNGND